MQISQFSLEKAVSEAKFALAVIADDEEMGAYAKAYLLRGLQEIITRLETCVGIYKQRAHLIAPVSQQQ